MPALRRAFIVSLGIWMVAAGCERKTDSAPPSGVPALPDAGPVAPSPSPSPHAGMMPPSPHPGMMPSSPHPGMMPSSPHGAVAAEGPAAAAGPSAVAGEIVLGDKVRHERAEREAIYVTVRQDDGTDRGPMVFVQRLETTALPRPIQLVVPGDGQGRPIAGKLLITARLDRDGDASSRRAGDVVGVARVTAPAKGVRVVLDRTLEQDEGPAKAHP